MTRTNIEWTDVTWNPVRGCAMVSAGCEHCYAMKQAHRFSGPGQPYAGLTEIGAQGPRWTGRITLVPEILDAPLRRRQPRRIFVNSMSDLFHEDVPQDFIHEVFAVMALSPQYTFQILTKRPERMRQLLDDKDYFFWSLVEGHAQRIYSEQHPEENRDAISMGLAVHGPLPNVHLGVSVEDQVTADERIPILLQTPAAVRWVSLEPLLGAVNVTKFFPRPLYHCVGCGRELLRESCGKCSTENNTETNATGGLNWVVCGGESGPRARPCDVAWIRSVVQQCDEAGVPCFVKQLGAKPYAVEGSVTAREWGAFNAAVAPMDDTGQIHCRNRKGKDMTEWPADLRIREFPR
ncbi:MAG: Phage Gp37/Gp68 family protein [Nitrospira sp.]|nr:MAG: Phage Gp37/Gp68 family protein [Nitrospira sp.]